MLCLYALSFVDIRLAVVTESRAGFRLLGANIRAGLVSSFSEMPGGRRNIEKWKRGTAASRTIDGETGNATLRDASQNFIWTSAQL